MKVHRRDRAPIPIHRRTARRRVFNAFTGTASRGTQRRPVELVSILRGIAQGVSTSQRARELGRDRPEPLEFRHRLRESAFASPDRAIRPDAAVEADEMYENPGGKGVPHRDEGDPPGRRADEFHGHGNWDNDRPPARGAVGRDGGQARPLVARSADRATLGGMVVGSCELGTMAYTDESHGYGHVAEAGRGHATGCHEMKEWARDDDGDGIRAVRDDTLGGMWAGLRD